MKTRFNNTLAKPASAIALAVAGLLAGGTAQAANTASGTDITNLATLNYSVGTVPQTAIGSSEGGNTSGAGTPTSFKVDNKVNLSLLETGNAVTSVTPGSVNQVTTFTLSNTGNTAQGYTFVAANASGAVIDGTADDDGFDVTNLRVFVESGTTFGFQPAEDTATVKANLAAGTSIVVYVLADVAITAPDTHQANITLTATTTAVNTTTAVSASTIPDRKDEVDIVFADEATTELNFVGASAASNGQATARDAYKVSTSALSVAKTVVPLCDPINGNVNSKNIPGAYVRYTITVSNASTASSSALLTTITDSLVGKPVTLDPNLISGLTAAACVPAGAETSAAGSGFVVSVRHFVTSHGSLASYLTYSRHCVTPN